MAEAQESADSDEYDEKNVNSEEEAYEYSEENPEEYKKQLELIRTPGVSREEQFKKLSYFFDADFIRNLKK